MKKSLLALAVASLAMSSAASAATVYDKDGDSLDIYGRVQGVLYSTDAAGLNSYKDNSLQASGRLGFDMRTQVMPGVAAFATMEWDVADGTRGDGGEWGVRYAFLGLDFGQYGVVKGGRFEDALKPVLAATDIFDDWGANAQVTDSDKRDGIIMYSWSGSGFEANVSYQTAANDQVVKGFYKSETSDLDHAYAASVGYTSAPVLFGPVALKAGYSFAQTQVDEKSAENQQGDFFTRTGSKLDKIDSYALSASWGDLSNGFYVAALYNERNLSFDVAGKSDTKISGAEAAVAYAFTNGVTLATGFNCLKFDDGSKTVTAKVVPVYANYQMSPRFNVWAEARLDAGTDDDVKNDKSFVNTTGVDLEENVYSVGARYTF